MRARTVNEAMNFKRIGDSKKSLGVGNRAANRDRKTRLENFKKDNPEVLNPSSGETHLMAPGEHPRWQTISIQLTDSPYSLEENKAKYLKWVQDNTDFDIIEMGDGYEREFTPTMVKNPKRIKQQGMTVRMRNEEDVS